jgi:hypothetical protein
MSELLAIQTRLSSYIYGYRPRRVKGVNAVKPLQRRSYQFGEHKSTNSRGEIDGNLINNNQKEGYTHCQKPSQLSQPSQLRRHLTMDLLSVKMRDFEIWQSGPNDS